VNALNLEGWQDGQPVTSSDERKAIEAKILQFHLDANEVAGHEVSFSREASNIIKSRLTAEALEELAGSRWKGKDALPQDWKQSVSTYLKAWAVRLSPWVLIDLARLLIWAGYRSEAKEALNTVVDWFPVYSPRYWTGDVDSSLMDMIMANARNLLDSI
jgi:hypothetical protein